MYAKKTRQKKKRQYAPGDNAEQDNITQAQTPAETEQSTERESSKLEGKNNSDSANLPGNALATKQQRKARSRHRTRLRLQEKKAKKLEAKELKSTLGKIGFFSGFLTMTKGVGKTCAGIAASPLLKYIGLGIMLAAIVYLFWNWVS